ncbi:MAG: hypothetical protein AAF587_10300 [Bacteroidota bacterium]
MKLVHLVPMLALLSLLGCIGDDFLLDTVDETVRITNPIDSLKVGDAYRFEATYFNKIGLEESQPITWTSSDPDVMTMSSDGLAIGESIGEASARAFTILNTGDTIRDELPVIVNADATSASLKGRTGALEATSSYILEGAFGLRDEGGGTLVLEFGEDYLASSSLPGLYIYLTNNPSTNSGALEIGEVTVFSGAHSYTITGGVSLTKYSHVLYYCKPFGVKVGEGEFDN